MAAGTSTALTLAIHRRVSSLLKNKVGVIWHRLAQGPSILGPDWRLRPAEAFLPRHDGRAGGLGASGLARDVASVDLTGWRASFSVLKLFGAQVTILQFSLRWCDCAVRVNDHGLGSDVQPAFCFDRLGSEVGVALERWNAGLGTDGSAGGSFAVGLRSLVDLTCRGLVAG